MRRSVIPFITILAVATAGIGWCPVPWSAGLFAAALLLALAARGVRGVGSRVILVNLAAVILALAAFESYLGYRDERGDGTRMAGTITEGFHEPDDDLGYRPRAATRVTATKSYGDALIYDVTYSIGTDGLRVMPPAAPGAPAGCVVFFGDSVTFGEGVADDEAYPFLVARRLGSGWTAHNLAFSGYGPQQMLARLQSGATRRLAGCRPTQFVYLAILEHVARVAGLTRWDRHGPRFRLGPGGVPVRDGNFDTPPMRFGGRPVPPAVTQAVDEFRAWQRFSGRGRSPGQGDLELFLAVVAESARLARELHPGSRFDVILWDGRDDDWLGVIRQRLENAGLGVHWLTEAVPGFPADADRYLFPHDGHPSPEMHRLLAQYVVDVLIAGGNSNR
jgi:hypothetical protein